MCMRVCVCVCVCERERERESVRACVCVSKSLTLLSKSSCVYNLNGEFTKWEKHNAFDGEAKRERESNLPKHEY